MPLSARERDAIIGAGRLARKEYPDASCERLETAPQRSTDGEVLGEPESFVEMLPAGRAYADKYSDDWLLSTFVLETYVKEAARLCGLDDDEAQELSGVNF